MSTVVALSTLTVLLCAAVTLGRHRRRPPRRTRSIAEQAWASSGPLASRARACVGDRVADRVADRVGRAVVGVVGRRAATLPARRVGAAVLVGAVLLFVHPVAGLGGAILCWVAPGLLDARSTRRRERQVLATLPEAVDVLALGLSAGLSPWESVDALARNGEGPVADAAAAVVRHTDRGARLIDALGILDDLSPWSARLGDALRAAMTSGVGAESALLRLGNEVRDVRRRDAEDRARRMPVLLLFPLVCCILPAFALLSVVPIVVVSLGSLQP